jgi:predicted ATPase
MVSFIEDISISGFKSIKNLDKLQLSQLNVLVGANGSGKTNLISFFELLSFMINKTFGIYVSNKGGADILLHAGKEIASQISSEINFRIYKPNNLSDFDYDGYKMTLDHSETNTLYFSDEQTYFRYGNRGNASIDWHPLYNTSSETKLSNDITSNQTIQTILAAMKSWKFFHFHDTSFRSKMKFPSDINDANYLRTSGENIAAFLYGIELNHNQVYEQICETVRLVAPFFTRFALEPDADNRVVLKWFDEYGHVMMPSQFSDGTIRFICLVSLLLQPNPPAFICMDEPELGLHPYAIEILASLIKECSAKSQLLISTQSPLFLDFFEPDNIIVSERKDGESVFKRLNNESLKHWLEEFSLGETWRANAFGGVPEL